MPTQTHENEAEDAAAAMTPSTMTVTDVVATDADDDNAVVVDGTSEESRKEHAAAEIMATLIKPPPPSGAANANAAAAVVPAARGLPPSPKKRAAVGAVARPRQTAASIAAEAAAAWKARGGVGEGGQGKNKKRKEVGGTPTATSSSEQNKKAKSLAAAAVMTATTTTTVATSASAVGLPSAVSLSAALRRVSDAELVRVVASEFKRRGYAVALQIESAPQEGVEEGGNMEGPSPPPPPSRKSKAHQQPQSKKKKERKDGPSPLSLPPFPFYPSTVFVTDKNAESWNAMYRRLKAYHDDNGGALPLLHIPPATASASAADGGAAAAAPAPAADDGNPDLALYKWTRAQSNLWKRMKRDGRHNLSLDRIAMLHSLDFDRAEDIQKDIKARMLLNSSSSAAGASGGGGEGGVEGGEDSEAEKGAAAAGAGGQSSHKQLMMMMAVPGRNAVKWQEKFENLRSYKEANGDTNVPRSYDDRLSKWCAVQRMRCKEVMTGDPKTPMTKAQYQALKDIGFNMDDKRKRYDRSVIDRKWEDKFTELVQYKEKYGNCDVAVRKGFEQYKQLANWAGLMRRKYKARQTGTKAGRTTGITDEQIKKLASCGFSFSLQDDFDTRFKHLLDFKKEFGHTKVPVFYTGHNNLGRWAKRMRDGIRNNEPWMDDMRKSRLLGIDFDIAVRHVFGHKPSKKSSEDGSDDGTMEDATAGEYAEGEEAMQAEAVSMAQQMDDNDFGRPSLPPLHQYPNTTGGGSVTQFFYGYPQGSL